MAIALRISDNTNGNAGVIFYSASLFSKAGTPVALGNVVTMSFFVLGTLLAICIAGRFGRRPIMLWSLAVLNLCLFFMGICMMLKWNNLLLGTMAVYFTFVNIGPCTIAWIYTAEIATKKSISVANTAAWA
jgi:MFS family permease